MATSYEVREELDGILDRDLLGPWGGPEEELAPGSNPRERYLVGVLGPKDAGVEPEVTDMGLGDSGDDGDAEPREIAPLLSAQAGGRIWASSMGMSFCVPEAVASVLVTAEWGHYRKTESEQYQRKDGAGGRLVWKRHPVSKSTPVPLDQPHFQSAAHDDFPNVHLAARIVRAGGRIVVDLALVNRQELPDAAKDEAWLFQPSLTVTAPGGEMAIFSPMSDPVEDPSVLAGKEFEDRHLALLFRDSLEHASGRNVAVAAEVRPDERKAWKLSTTWLPTYDVPQTVAPKIEDTPLLAGLELEMEKLASLSPADLTRALLPLADGYATWLQQRSAEITSSLPGHLRDTATEAVRRARQIEERIRAGIGLLCTSENRPLEAFRFANKAMALQRRHSEIVRARAKDPALSLADAQRLIAEQGPPTWRPFQLAFILLNLPALSDPQQPERAAGQSGVVDLLFFPTGGGKTEAYLGLTAFTLAIRRLQGLVGTGSQQRSGMDGTAVLMRYTLRLLTAQQFQRAATLICACEQLRHDDARLGERPFRIGLWVGAKVSPNWYREAAAQVEQARDGRNVRSSALQVINCPWCGTELRADRDLHPDSFRRIVIYCGDPDGECPFSRKRSGGGDVHPLNRGLPVLTVDEEIYRLTPSLVIATVDKLAQLPWQGYAGMLFGRVSQWCPRHGYRHGDMDAKIGCAGHHNRKADADAVESQPVMRLRPPDLIIQDELHLIAGALGTTVGLFEAAVDELSSWRVDDHDVGPKIVASTATVKRAAEQALQLFARNLAIFPPPVLDQGDTFFSRQEKVTPESPGRRYLGACAHGVRLKSAEIKLAEILLIAGQYLLDQHGRAADPYLTLVGYFNATRELAGMRRYLDDDIATRVRRNGRRRGLSDRLATMKPVLGIQELTSRVSSAVIGLALRQLEVAFDPAQDGSAALEAMRQEVVAARQEKREPKLPPKRDPGPTDVVLATSMLQVGVDVQRLGLMVVTGQPKNTAEYLQATGRVGRDPARPGLVVTLYNWARPRDLAHYENFAHYHATAAKDVEALSVTPYARRALDREFAATFIAIVRNLDERYSRNRDAHDLPLDGEIVTEVRRRLRHRASIASGPAFDGAGYLDEKAKALLDEWARRRDSTDFRLGFQPQKTETENIVGLLDKPEQGEWTALTVGMSMRETENEVNLLLPRQTLADISAAAGPGWSFGAPSPEPDEDIPAGDELGEAT